MKELNNKAVQRMKHELDVQWRNDDISDEVYHEAMKWINTHRAPKKPSKKNTLKRFFK